MALGQIGFMPNTPLYSSPAQSMGYQYSGPTNFGPTQYVQYSSPGAHGLYGYNPAIAPAPASYQSPYYTNTLSPGSWNKLAASTRAQQNPMTLAGDSPLALGRIASGTASNIPIGGGAGNVMESATGGTPPSSFGAWDPQGTAYNMMFNNKINPALALRNLNKYADQMNQSGLFANPYAGQAMASVAGAESGGNPFATNASSGAYGMNQWLNSRGSPRAQNASYLMAGNYSPEVQGTVAMSEILGGGYPGVYGALNNPNSSMTQMQRAGVNQFEGLQGSPSQAASDMAGAAGWAGRLTYGTTAHSNTLAQNVGAYGASPDLVPSGAGRR